MAGKLTQEAARARVIEIHGDVFDLSKLVYSKSLSRVVIGCKKHGDFSIVFKALTLTKKYSGCPVCTKEALTALRATSKGITAMANANKIANNALLALGRRSVAKDRKIASLLLKFSEVHGDKNDYSNVVYTRMDEKVEIRCKEHGQVFHQSPAGHLLAQGCNLCSFKKRSKSLGFSQEDFIQKATEAHSGKYDYSLSVYKPNGGPISIICPVHGQFSMSASSHMCGRGCQLCGWISGAAVQTGSAEDFASRGRALYGDKCDYSMVNYVTARTKVKIRCIKHDHVYEQAPHVHLRSSRGSNMGCQLCSNASLAEARSAGIGGFLAKAEAAHQGRFNYDKVEYVNARTHVIATCKEHGDFRVVPWAHWCGSGCQKCPEARSGGFATSKPGILYVMTCGDITKVGITNNSLTGRSESIGKSYGGTFEVARTYQFEDGQDCSDTETILIRLLRTKYESPSKKFDGYTESFMNVDRPWLYEQIEMLGVENV